MNLRLMAPQRDQQSGSTALGACWASDRAKSGSGSSAAARFSAASASPASAVSARACNLTEDIDSSAASTASEGADSAEDEGPASRAAAPWPADTPTDNHHHRHPRSRKPNNLQETRDRSPPSRRVRQIRITISAPLAVLPVCRLTNLTTRMDQEEAWP